jgi:hypothetical protein
MLRELYSANYESKQFTDEDSLNKLILRTPDKISTKLTHLWGNGQFGNRFGFLTMSEGQGNIKDVNDRDYFWDTMGEMHHTSEVVSFDVAANPAPGYAHSTFDVVFKDSHIIPQYGLLAPDGKTHAYVHGEGEEVSGLVNGFKYTLQLKTTDYNASCDIANLISGKFWVMTAPNVAESGSVGNRSNVMGPGRMTNMVSFKRYSKRIQGNLANKVVQIEFSGSDTVDGKPSSLWINEEQRQFELDIREHNNHDLYLSRYNKDANGVIHLRDKVSQKVIPIGAGIEETIEEEGNADSYGFTLPLRKVKNILSEAFWGKSDSGKKELIFHGGMGFVEDFGESIMGELVSHGSAFLTAVGDRFVMSGKDGFLKYGNSFRQFVNPAGHLVTVIHDVMFDTGFLGELDRKNNNLHPRTGYPMSSHTGVLMDYSTYDGDRNIIIAQMKGQANIVGVVKGAAPLPASWGKLPDASSWATEKDETSYHVKQSRSINILDGSRCFKLASR